MIKQIEKLARDISIDLYKYNENLNVYLFGSSLRKYCSLGRDIDILILENCTNVRLKFCEQLLKMQKEFLDHGVPYSFSTYNQRVGYVFDKLIAKVNKNNNIKISAKFIFGPLDKSIIPAQNELLFHVKGPVFIDEFKLFCERFPFHAKSIIHNNKRLIGEFEIYDLDKYISINKSNYMLWLKSLKMRVDKSELTHELIKLIEKLIYTFLIYSHKYTINESTINNVLNRFNLEIYKNKNISYLKDAFNKLFIYALNSTRTQDGHRTHTILK